MRCGSDRDAARNRVAELFANGQGRPHGVDLNGKFIFCVGPVDPVRDEMVGPAGPTMATRMDKFTEMILEKTGLLDMIGKAEREPASIEATKSISARCRGSMRRGWPLSSQQAALASDAPCDRD